jgi:hypothetical protein
MDSSFNNMAAESVQAKVTSGGGRDAADVAPGGQQSPGLFQQIIEHSEKFLRPTIVSSGELRDRAVDRLAPSLSRRTLRYTIDEYFPRDQF